MLTPTCQRWRDRRGTYRPAGEPIRTAEYDVTVIATDREARAFVERHHYSGAYVAARFRVGLHRRGELVGVVVLSQPPSQAALDAALPFGGEGRAELGRLVLLDDVAANGESWFVAQAFALARAEGFTAVVSHADPEHGHVGTVYQALSAVYVGQTPRRTRRYLADGKVLSARALSKLRGKERGWRYVVEELVSRGAPPPAGDWRAWITRAVDAVTVPRRHPGNHRYLWALDRRLRRRLPEGQAYPKLDGGRW